MTNALKERSSNTSYYAQVDFLVLVHWIRVVFHRNIMVSGPNLHHYAPISQYLAPVSFRKRFVH